MVVTIIATMVAIGARLSIVSYLCTYNRSLTASLARIVLNAGRAGKKMWLYLLNMDSL